MPKLGITNSIVRNYPRRRTLSSASPIPASGLSLWLKADAGVTSTPEVYISQLVVSGAGTASANGTYALSADGSTYDNVDIEGNSQLVADPGNYYNWILYGDAGPQYDNEYLPLYVISIQSSSIDDMDYSYGVEPSPSITPSLSTNPNTLLVTDWADQSGNSRNATAQTIGPTFIASSINSKPAISFNEDGSWLQVPQNNIGDNGSISIFVVLNYVSGLVIFNKGDAATYEATSWEITTINGFGFVDPAEGDPAWNTVPISIATGTPLLLEAFSDETLSQLAFNGVNSGDPSDSNEFGTNNISQYLGIGGGGTNGGNQENPLNARIAEIIIYNRQVTNPERVQVETYLMDKYAICLDSTSSVLMTGWVAGPRTLTPIGYAPYGNETYTYGAEVVRYETGVWIYANSEGGGEIARAYSTASRPWLATWPAGFTAEKVCS